VETLFRAGVNNAVSATLLAMVVACLSRPLARRPAILHCLWLLVLLKLVTPPLYEVPIPWPASSGPLERKGAAAVVMPTVVESLPRSEMTGDAFEVEWKLVTDLPDNTREETRAAASSGQWSASDWVGPLVAIWLVGTAMIVIVSFRRIRRFQSLLQATRPASRQEQAWVDAMASRLGLRRGPVFEWVQAKLSPMIWSLGWRPRLIIPRDLWKTLDEPQRSTLIVHELAHLRRGDHRVRYFELLVTAVFWWHPLVWWVRQALRDAEEQCCDAWVVWAFPDAARSYAETLLETIDFLDKSKGPEPLLASGFGKVHHLRRRLTMILSESTPRRLGAWGMLGLFGLAAMMLPVNATWAQKPPEPNTVDVVVKAIDELSGKTDGAPKSQAETLALHLNELVLMADPVQEVKFVVNLKTDDSPEVVVSGSAEEVIKRLKLILKEVQDKSSRTAQDEKVLKSLRQAIEELGTATAKINGNVHVENTGGSADRLMFAVRTIDADSPKKPLSKEETAEIEKLQAQVKKLNGELQAKQAELVEAQGRLAKLQGVNPSAMRFGSRLKGKLAVVVPDGVHAPEKIAPKVVVVDRKYTRTTNEKIPKTVETKEVDPTKRQFEVMVGSSVGHGEGHMLGVKELEIRTDKLVLASEQHRIEELEKKLKALLDEVASLKKDQSKGAAAK
jgi:beta-lactamase regulating signal transducer with metallopeptidase domain